MAHRTSRSAIRRVAPRGRKVSGCGAGTSVPAAEPRAFVEEPVSARSSGARRGGDADGVGPRDRDLESAARCCSRRPGTRSSISCATTWRSRDGALRAAGGRPNVLVRYPNGVGDGVLLPEARAGVAPRLGGCGHACASLRAAPPRKSCRATRPPSRGWRTSPASSCTRIRCAPRTLDHPDELRVDLDPVPGVTWEQIREVARTVHSALDDLSLVGWPKTSGSRGIHVYVRIHPRWTFAEVRRAALALAREVERRAPALATSKWWKEERHGVFLDYNQNAKDRTVAAAYSVRPTVDARVSAPLSWDEIDACEPADFTLATMPSRFAALGDRHEGIDRAPCSLDALLELSARQEREGQGDAPWPPHYQEAGGRARTRAALASSHAGTSVDRNRARPAEDRRARGARTLEGPACRSGRAPRARRHPGRRHARAVRHVDPHSSQPAARARAAAACAGAARS